MAGPHEMTAPNTHGVVIQFGKHKGTPFTRLPVSYLKWMVNEVGLADDMKALAAAELERRGTVTPTLEVSGHAIDRASLRCRRTWHEQKQPNEGLHAWLVRQAAAARAEGTQDEQGRYHYAGMVFAFQQGAEWPVLATVMPEKKPETIVLDDTSDASSKADREKLAAWFNGDTIGSKAKKP